MSDPGIINRSPGNTMTFGLQTLFALMSSVALVLTCFRSKGIGFALILFVLPFSMMIIGITSPQRGNQLDPSARWYLFVLLKTWIFTLSGLILLLLIFFISPYLRDRFVRALKGDTRSYQITISFLGDRSTSDGLKGKPLTLHDSNGFIGDVRRTGCRETLLNGKVMISHVWLLVSTDRSDVLDRNGKQYTIDIRPDGSLYIAD